jgi:hypothetical protein
LLENSFNHFLNILSMNLVKIFATIGQKTFI